MKTIELIKKKHEEFQSNKKVNYFMQMAQTYTIFFEAMKSITRNKSKNTGIIPNTCYYDYILSILNENILSFLLAYVEVLNKDINFLDAGAGMGNILYIIKKFHPKIKTFGIEYNNTNIELIQKTYLLNSVLWPDTEQCDFQIKQADLTVFDNYNSFDVIYLYQPIQDRQILKSAYKRIANQLSSHKVIIVRGDYCPKVFEETGFEKISFGIWIKK